MNQTDIYLGAELDSEWAQYIASLNKKNQLISRKHREKKRIEKRERETMINLQKHIRGLSRARFELEDAAIDSFDDSSSDTGTVNIIQTPTPINETNTYNGIIISQINDNTHKHQPQQSNTPTVSSLINKPLSYDNYNININNEMHRKKKIRNNKTILAPIMIPEILDASDDDPYNIKSDENDMTNYDSNDSDINDSHCINDSNSHDSNDSNDSLSDSDNSNHNSLSPKSLKSSKSSSINSNQSNDNDNDNDNDCIEQQMQYELYDQELEALKKELNQFKKRNFSRLRRTKSQEEVLLSVLNIDQKNIDKKQLEKCTKKAITKYNTMTQREKRRVLRNKKEVHAPYNTVNITHNHRHLLNNAKLSSKTKQRKRRHSNKSNRNRHTKLADPYNEEWNGLDPTDYVWYDEMPEGQCYDDKELSLYNRRMQFLVVMAIENHYCSISDLTYQQNELLLLYQSSLNF